MASMIQQFKGVRVSLLSHSLVRYVGTLEDINSQSSTLSVSNGTYLPYVVWPFYAMGIIRTVE